MRRADEADSQQSRPEGTVPEATIQDPAKLLHHQVPIKETQHKTADLTIQPVNRMKKLASDLEEIDFSQEILPLNESNVKSLKGDFLFWSVSFLGIVPLMIGILSDSHSQIVAFCLFFCVCMGSNLQEADSAGLRELDSRANGSVFYRNRRNIFALNNLQPDADLLPEVGPQR